MIGGYTQPAGERKHLGALLVGVYGNGKFKFAGRVGTGFSEKLLKLLSAELNKIAVKDCPFDNLPATRHGLDQGLTAAEMKRCVWVKPIVICEVKFTEWTRDDRLRQAVFLGIRDDKSPSAWFGNRRNLSDYRRSKLLARNFSDGRATPRSLDDFLAQQDPDNFSLAKSRGLWASKLTWQTFRVCTEEMDDLPQRPSN